MMISPQELKGLLENKQADLLDIRTREEYEVVHLEGAQLLDQAVMQAILSTRARDRLLVIVDHQGSRSLDAAAYFAGHGFTNVKCLRGGIDAWSTEIDPTLPRYTLE
jgi:rhodanese-related sulfurtransferase